MDNKVVPLIETKKDKKKYHELISKVEQFQASIDWLPLIKDFDILSCIRYDAMNKEKNIESDECAIIRKVK